MVVHTGDDLSSCVPVIDISELGSDPSVAERIVAAAEWPGFFHITHHGVEQCVIADLQHTSEYLFRRTPQQALDEARRDTTNSRGYFDDELTKQKRDWKRCLDAGCQEGGKLGGRSEVDGENRWPREDAAPGLRAAAEAFVPQAAAVSLRLLAALLPAAGFADAEAADYLRALSGAHTSFLRLNYYPPCPDTAANKGIERHTDAGLLTLLLHDDVQALQVRVPPRPGPGGRGPPSPSSSSSPSAGPTAAERWEFVRPVPGAFTVNVGDMLTVLSNGRFPAPEHRVLANGSQERFSYAFFFNPGYADVIAPQPATSSPPRFQPVLWAEFRQKRYEGDVRDVGEERQITHYKVLAT